MSVSRLRDWLNTQRLHFALWLCGNCSVAKNMVLHSPIYMEPDGLITKCTLIGDGGKFEVWERKE